MFSAVFLILSCFTRKQHTLFSEIKTDVFGRISLLYFAAGKKYFDNSVIRYV